MICDDMNEIKPYFLYISTNKQTPKNTPQKNPNNNKKTNQSTRKQPTNRRNGHCPGLARKRLYGAATLWLPVARENILPFCLHRAWQETCAIIWKYMKVGWKFPETNLFPSCQKTIQVQFLLDKERYLIPGKDFDRQSYQKCAWLILELLETVHRYKE